MKRTWLILILILHWSISSACSLGTQTVGEQPTVAELTYVGYGAQRTVAGSLHVLDLDGDLYLVDVGSFMGNEGANYPWPASIPVDRVQAVFITHAHADHIGRIPLLLRVGYTGPIYMTHVTYDLAKLALVANLSLVDFGQEEFYYSRNNRNVRKPVYLEGYDFGEYTVRPHNRIYFTARRPDLDGMGFYLAPVQVEQLADELLERLQQQVRILHPGNSQIVGPFHVQFLYTSHMPGSVMVKFSLDDFRVLFSGDVGGNSSRFLEPNPLVEGLVHVLIVEGTYADDRDINYRLERERFREQIGDFVRQGYRVVIPAFVMDRTQQVLYEISEGVQQGSIPHTVPVKVYSRAANDITDLYEDYAREFSRYEQYFSSTMAAARFKPPGYAEASTSWESPDPLALKHGEIGVMSSGMAEYAYAKQALLDYLDDSMTVFCFVGYQGEGTPGRVLTDGATRITLDGRSFEVRAAIERTVAFSGHATPADILDLFNDSGIQKVFLVHLEARNAPALSSRYREHLGVEVIMPHPEERHLLYRKEAGQTNGTRNRTKESKLGGVGQGVHLDQIPAAAGPLELSQACQESITVR